MEEKEITTTESLKIIDTMINKAKNKLADDGVLLIFWGWLVFAAAVIHYVTLRIHVPYGEYTWAILMPIGGLISFFYGFKQRQKEKVRTHMDGYLGYSWGGFIIALAVTLVFMQANGIKATYFFLMVLYGLATFISGGLLNFRPLIIGSIFSFLFAIVSIYTYEVEILLCLAGAILCSYIIPGHLLYSKYKSQVNV